MYVAQKFLSQVNARSEENNKAFEVLFSAELFGVCIGLLRQELDTLIRLCYLWHADTSANEAIRLMELSVNGHEWQQLSAKGKPIRLKDRDMVNLASHLGGWEQLIYNFGCKLIHLSNAHLYRTDDPIAQLPKKEREVLVGYLHTHHGFPHQTVSMEDVIQYLPNVKEKLSENIEFYVEELKLRFRVP